VKGGQHRTATAPNDEHAESELYEHQSEQPKCRPAQPRRTTGGSQDSHGENANEQRHDYGTDSSVREVQIDVGVMDEWKPRAIRCSLWKSGDGQSRPEMAHRRADS
jgi:hypothetical protein